MWLDTHCHLDADEFDGDRAGVVARARASGVSMMVLPAAHVDHFAKAAAVAREFDLAYALGLHPLWLEHASETDVDQLRVAARAALADPRFVAIGEIGLDFFVAGFDREKQEWFYRAQLQIARELDLPVIVHVRRSADALLKHLRRIEVAGGIVHAFNGSEVQAQALVARGMRLGFGGAMTYDGSRRIRQFAATLADDAWVLETDAPDIPPRWLRDGATVRRNEPAELPRIAETMCALRGRPADEIAASNRRNAQTALPRLAKLMSPPP